MKYYDKQMCCVVCRSNYHGETTVSTLFPTKHEPGTSVQP